jgi:Ni/Co efflux regulator RcnB
MRSVIAAIAVSLALTPFAFAQEKKAPSAAQKKQQERMKDCNEKAGDKKGEERKAFMSSCLKGGAAGGEPSAAQKKQQNRMSACNKQATEKKLKGEERKGFMSSCLKG